MIVTVLGAHGQIARLLTAKLVERGHSVKGVIRNEDQSDDVRADGAEPVICDLESSGPDEFDDALRGSDAVVFAAGAGPDSGAERKNSLDRDGAIRSVDSAGRLGIDRFVIVSSMGVDDPPQDDESFSIYLRAKAAADDAVRAASPKHTVLRPGALTDDAATGSVRLATSTGRGSIPRADVAEVLAEVLDGAAGIGATFELISGDTPIPEAVSGV